MSIESTIYSQLVADVGVKAIIGSRAFPVVADAKSALPLLIYRRVSTEPNTALDGIRPTDSARIQVDCVAATYQAAKALADAVRTAIGGYQTQENGGFRTCSFQDESDEYDSPQDADEIGVFRVSQEYLIWFN